MSDERPPRLSGWCVSAPGAKPDQFHDFCRSETCQCEGHADARSLVAQGKVVSKRYNKDGSDRGVSAPQPEPDPASLDYTEEQG